MPVIASPTYLFPSSQAAVRSQKKTFPLATIWVTTAIRFVHYIKQVPVINMN